MLIILYIVFLRKTKKDYPYERNIKRNFNMHYVKYVFLLL